MDSIKRSAQEGFFAGYYDRAGVLSQILSPADDFEREVVLGRFKPSENLSQTLTALDVGCGYGRYARFLLDLGYFYIGIDPVSQNIERLEKELETLGYKKGKHFELYCGTLESLSNDSLNGKCDVAFSINVIHHTVSAKQYLTEIVKCVKSAGAVVVIEPNPMNLLHWISYALQRSLREEWKFLIFNPLYLIFLMRKLGKVSFSSLGPAPLRFVNRSTFVARIYRFWGRRLWSPIDPFFRYEILVKTIGSVQ